MEFWEGKLFADPGIEPMIAATLGFPDPHQVHYVLPIHRTDLLGVLPSQAAGASIVACTHDFSMTGAQTCGIRARL
jgi:hypothetical protein